HVSRSETSRGGSHEARFAAGERGKEEPSGAGHVSRSETSRGGSHEARFAAGERGKEEPSGAGHVSRSETSRGGSHEARFAAGERGKEEPSGAGHVSRSETSRGGSHEARFAAGERGKEEPSGAGHVSRSETSRGGSHEARFAAGERGKEEPSGPARPPPLTDDSYTASVPRDRHVDIGATFVFISPISNSIGAEPAQLRYRPGPGVSAYTRIVLLRYLHAAAVFSWAEHAIDADLDALGARGPLETGSMTSYRLEAHAMPTLPIGERVRLFGIVGLGWGRLEVGPMSAPDGDGSLVIRGRGASYFDVPLGAGGSIEIIPNWMAFDFALWGAPTFAKEGTAHTPLLAIDGDGHAQQIGPLPEVPVWFVQSLGLSLLL
ncbi:MAG: hypothetical protein HOW73_45025, partial [Polyangiaceae bacterium]|nr:hypothetical protein [Polyangiaceae bacterium]